MAEILSQKIHGLPSLTIIFGRVFAKDRPLSLLPARVANDGRLSGIAVSQFEIQHGWIAVAFSEDRPDRPATTAARRGGN